jgi:MFS family permease
MNFTSGLLSLMLAAMMLSDAMQFPALLAIMALSSIFTQFHNSALDTSYAMIVPNALLPRANGMMQTMFSLSGILAPPVAAAVISLPALARQGRLPSSFARPLANMASGAPLAIAADAVTFFIAAATLAFLYIPSPKRTDLAGISGKPRKSMWADVKEGGVYILRRRPLLLLLCTFALVNFASGPVGVFFPLILKFRLAPDWSARGLSFETAMALMGAIGSAGGLAGGFIISAWGGLRKRRIYGILIPMVVSGLAQVAFGLSNAFFLTAGVVAVFSAMGPFMNAHSQAIWQNQTPRELQGRVFAVRRVIAQFSWPISTAMAGWAGATFSPGAVMAVLGAAVVLVGVRQMVNPTLIRVDDKEWLDQVATGTVQPVPPA